VWVIFEGFRVWDRVRGLDRDECVETGTELSRVVVGTWVLS